MAFDCLVAKYIRKKVFKEWWACTTDCSWVMHPMFKSCFFNKGDNTLEIAKRTLNDIATYHIWRYRCNIIYGGKVTLSVITANEIWVEFTNSIMARVNHIKVKKSNRR
jgi:hypothetical protein